MIPSVTETISPWNTFDRIPADVLDAAAERGTAVHNGCFAIAKGLIPVVPEGLAGYVESYRKWHKSQVAEYLVIEQRIIDPEFSFHGEPDLIVRLKDGRIALIDIKTPITRRKAWKTQIAAYRRLAELAGHKIDLAGSLQLSPEGKAPRMNISDDGGTALIIFLQMLNVYRYMNEGGN